MVSGIPYDSEDGRAIAGALTAIMSGDAYATSAEMAGELGAFPGFAKNREPMLRVMRNHRRAAYGATDGYEGLTDPAGAPRRRESARTRTWSGRAARLGHAPWRSARQHGYRNAQVTVLAPTGTIGLLMDCDTTGIEPDFALVKFKKLAGGGYFKIINRIVPEALQTPRLQPRARSRRSSAMRSATARSTGAPHINHARPQGARASPTTTRRRSRARSPASSTSSSPSTPGSSARSSARPRSASPRRSSTTPASTCWRRSGFTTARDRGRPTPTAAAP